MQTIPGECHSFTSRPIQSGWLVVYACWFLEFVHIRMLIYTVNVQSKLAFNYIPLSHEEELLSVVVK